jgi:hypothetical protein
MAEVRRGPVEKASRYAFISRVICKSESL